MAGTGIVNVDISGIMSGAGQLLKDIRTAWTGKNPELEAKLVELEMTLSAAQNSAQSEINKIEAASNNLFVSGWRPYVGWVCGISYSLVFVIFPLISYISAFFGKEVPFPALDIGELATLLFGMMGLVGVRTYEKAKGISK